MPGPVLFIIEGEDGIVLISIFMRNSMRTSLPMQLHVRIKITKYAIEKFRWSKKAATKVRDV